MSKKLRLSCAILVLAAAVIAATGSAAHAQKLLRLKFTPGETLHYVMTQEQATKAKVGTTPITTNTTMTMYMDQKVESVDSEGVASMTMTLTRIQMKMTSPQGLGIDYDSASGKPPEGLGKMVAPIFEAMVKKPIAMKMDPQAKVSDLKLPQGLMEALKNMGGEKLGGVFSEEGMKQMAGVTTYPKEPVAPGKTWSEQNSMSLGPMGKLTQKSTFRYDGTEQRGGKELEKIGMGVEMDIAAEPGKPQAIQIKMRNVKGDGVLYFDNAAGRLQESTMKIKMQMDLEFAGQKIEQEMDMNQVFRLVPGDKTP